MMKASGESYTGFSSTQMYSSFQAKRRSNPCQAVLET